jgi:hypothetical protein
MEGPDLESMNLTRRLIKLVDLRMHHYLAGEKMDSSYRLHRVHSIRELALDHTGQPHFDPAKKSIVSPCC